MQEVQGRLMLAAYALLALMHPEATHSPASSVLSGTPVQLDPPLRSSATQRTPALRAQSCARRRARHHLSMTVFVKLVTAAAPAAAHASCALLTHTRQAVPWRIASPVAGEWSVLLEQQTRQCVRIRRKPAPSVNGLPRMLSQRSSAGVTLASEVNTQASC